VGNTRIGVRPARLSDRDQVWPLARDLATSYVVERPAFGRSFALLLADANALVLVAERPGAPEYGVVGYLLATSHPAFHANGPVVWVEEVMVAAGARAAGVGRQLMAAAEDWAHDRGARYVALATRRAAPFYQALGYQDSAVYFKKSIA
jgi:GNAT superfamily N-acetyltransferase